MILSIIFPIDPEIIIATAIIIIMFLDFIRIIIASSPTIIVTATIIKIICCCPSLLKIPKLIPLLKVKVREKKDKGKQKNHIVK